VSFIQRVKLTEVDDMHSEEGARVPRSVEVEVRGTLVNTCVAGDVLCVVGAVRALQTDAPRGIY
jgi:DNA replicative helicase MCM subunit Mcm2 (Cdc46/Mcm family)